MGSVKHDESHQGGESAAQGMTDSSNYSQGSSWGQSGGLSTGQSTGQQNVWGAQQPALAQLYGQAQQMMGGQGTFGQQAQGVARQAQNAWANQLTPGGNPYFHQSVQAAIQDATQGFNRDIMPQMDARGVQAGQYGSPRDNLARAHAASDFGNELSRNVAGMYSQQYGADQQLAGQALGQAGAIQGMQMAPLTTAAGIIGGPTVLSSQQASNQATNWANQMAANAAGGQSMSRNSATSGSWGGSQGSGVGVAGGKS